MLPVASVPRRGPLPLVSIFVSALKSLKKALLLTVVASTIATVVKKVRSSSSPTPVSFDEWPDVPRNPDA
jgi:hypothetical protein